MNLTNPVQFGRQDVGPVNLKKKSKPTLQDLFPQKELNGASVQPIALGSVSIPGLTKESAFALGQNYFCVVNTTGIDELSELYKWNRQNGKPNFITVDSILHPYFAFKNGLLSAVIEDYLYEDMFHLLNATIVASVADYQLAEDDEVKDDMQRNLAYLTVGLKLLDPEAALPDIGGADKLVNVDYASCVKGIRAKSVIFNQNVDFSYVKPWGWYARSEKVARFFQCYQWLSRVYFPIRNVTVNTISGGGNSFRRAVLLYRSLTLGRVSGTPALVYWNRIGNAFAQCGLDNYYRIHTILPPDLTGVLNKSRGDFRKLVDVVSQPYARTKLMLSIRKERPVMLGSTSIFEIADGGKPPIDLEVFRFFPLVQPQEMNWLKHVAHEYKTESEEPTPTPLSLLTTHGHGCARATNLLSMQLESLDKRLLTAVPRLERIIAISNGGRNQSESDRRWSVISNLFRPYPEKAQTVLRTNLWLSRQLETAMAAWIDSYTACLPLPKSTEKIQSKTEEKSSSKGADGSDTTTVRKATFQYLDPRPVVYQLMAQDLVDLKKVLADLAVFPEAYSKRLDDFQRLFTRLDSIATRELTGEPISKQDFSLLASIDLLLRPVDQSLPESMFFNIGQAYGAKKEEGVGEGATIGIGNAGQLYIVCSTSQGATLCRGAVYTLYELAAGPYAERHWKRKLKYDLVRPPIWARPYALMQARDQSKSLKK